MGMDVFGAAPSAPVGEYFRNNIWFWNPLWTYIVTNHSSLLPGDPNHGFYNDGYGLNKDEAFALGAALLSDIKDGHVQQYKEKFDETLSRVELIECAFCDGTGIRTDSVGVEHNMPEQELDELIQLVTGRERGWCNSCRGLGKSEPHITSYSFDIENVREFAMFLINCGGFSIH
jgi:hypothetical protein